MEPYNPPDYRNEGTGKGLFSGEDGEFIIFQKGEPARTDGDSAESKQKETTD